MRHNWKALIALLLVAAMALTGLAGCGAKTDAAGTDAAGTDAAKKLKVALILPGKKDDVSFNQAMYEGVTAYAEAHADTIDLKVVENVYEVADIEPALSDFADQGYDVIFGHGFQLPPACDGAVRAIPACWTTGTAAPELLPRSLGVASNL